MSRHPQAVPLLQDHLSQAAEREPGKVALVCGEERFTYAELDQRASALSRTLSDLGVERGDRVMVFGDNGPQVVLSFWAALKAGGIITIINPQTKSDKLSFLLADCQPSALLADARLRRVFAEPLGRSAHLKGLVTWGTKEPPQGLACPRVLGFEEASVSARGAPLQKSRIDLDLAAIVYTSGSTGEPKGVMLTHRNMLTASLSISSYLEMRADDVIINVLPFSFDYGLYQMIMTFRVGGRLVLERSFTYPAQVLSRIHKERVTGFPGVPTLFSILTSLTDLSAYDFDSVRFVTNTAAALFPKHVATIRRLFPRARVYSMYGLTECKRISFLPPEEIDTRPDSVGLPIPNTEIWVVDEAGLRLGPDQVGQLVVRGATVMAGYWGRPEESELRLRPGPLPGERVLYTGDYARIDADGYLYFVGRMDDIIKSRGEKVAPREIEKVLTEIPGVKEAAVIGVPDEILGQAAKAFVVLEPGCQLTEAQVMQECQKRLEGFMVPKYIEFRAEFPKTTTGKIQKTALS